MTFKEVREELKQLLKSWAIQIRELKSQRKGAPCGYVEGLEALRMKYRVHHIVYCCEFLGTPYEEVERPREDNNIENNYWLGSRLNDIKKEWKEKIDAEETEETVRLSA